ncbi:hypothetical protein HZH66_000112 [Vespula vulgaris]|uniref:Uncharacterized protein n=1 Tax=Vespula vulgaris TaxID=7454 RepID=A0A834KQN8_VESVU|nr:hypothetical protein HZH66_000112 [Vespula vulgaris]
MSCEFPGSGKYFPNRRTMFPSTNRESFNGEPERPDAYTPDAFALEHLPTITSLNRNTGNKDETESVSELVQSTADGNEKTEKER